jgi:hypothetical protein
MLVSSEELDGIASTFLNTQLRVGDVPGRQRAARCRNDYAAANRRQNDSKWVRPILGMTARRTDTGEQAAQICALRRQTERLFLHKVMAAFTDSGVGTRTIPSSPGSKNY